MEIYIAERADGKGKIEGKISWIENVPFIKQDKKYSKKIKVMTQSIKNKQPKTD